MHPILVGAWRTVLYVVIWAVVGLSMAAALVLIGLFRWPEALAFFIPLALLYGFICLSALYICRMFPLRADQLWRTTASLLGAALTSSLLWVALGRVWTDILSSTGLFMDITELYRRQIFLLIAVGIELFLLASAISYLYIALEESQAAQTRALQLRVLATEAELKALRAQINPHFLFNSLNSVSALVTVDAHAARRMCLLLGEFLRGSLRQTAQDFIPLVDEMALLDQYLAIEKVRFGDRLRIERAVSREAEACLVPPLLLQPLVENAVTHGVAHLVEGGTISVTAGRPETTLRIAIANPYDPQRKSQPGAGVGLANVRARLSRLFGRDADLSMTAVNGQFRVELQMPCRSKLEQAEA